ncbi:hypothetical protein F511_18305 [Dorcoceras hygrometricum]|uniref:Uncharacterized protein n=1 Tax=Dorcoceras hygrometricum TaxID=472368 RepID=A0A2Z7D855_9LAMI|nr:hypothetical protein F511_18305 [Dorcoceras hygrometricum]
MARRRNIPQKTEENRNIETLSPGPKNQGLTAAQITQLVVTTIEQVGKAQSLAICDERRLVQRPRRSEGDRRNPKSERFYDFYIDYDHTTSKFQNLDQELDRIVQSNLTFELYLRTTSSLENG